MFRSVARVLIVPLVGAVVASATVAAITAADVLAQFNLGRPAAETYIFDAVWNQGLGYFSGTRIFKALPPEEMLEEMAASLEAQQLKMEKDKDLQAQMEKGHVMMAEMQQQNYVRAIKEFEKKYPENPQQLIATRLREFLAASATVPAEAALVERDGKLRFVDRKFEGRGDFWKQLYRSGKPAVDAARQAATTWLAAIESKSTM